MAGGGGPVGRVRPRSIPLGAPAPPAGPKPGGGGFAAAASSGLPRPTERAPVEYPAPLRRADGGAL
eukprot:12308232-Alexandrium_andersonii.AAC.1